MKVTRIQPNLRISELVGHFFRSKDLRESGGLVMRPVFSDPQQGKFGKNI
jgi:hypothetical protein